MKARAMLAANGHGDQLRHVSTRVVAPGGAAMNFPNQAIDSGAGAMPARPAMPSEAGEAEPGLMRGGRT